MNDSSRPCLLPRIIGGPQAETLPEGCSPLIDGGSLPCPGAVTRLEAISGLDEDYYSRMYVGARRIAV